MASLDEHEVVAPRTVRLEDILITDQLAQRTARPPDLQAEVRALHALARQLALQPNGMLELLVSLAVELCHADSAGVSLPETTPSGEKVFLWVALAGELIPFAGNTTPRDFSPCGVTLDRHAAQLFDHQSRYFTYFPATPPIVEGLVVPMYAGTTAVGTIWIASHNEGCHFDGEDARIMSNLADFSAAAVHISSVAADNARLYQEAQAALRARDTLIASISHDLRNPLTTIKGQAQSLSRMVSRLDDLRTLPVAEGLTRIDHAASRMAEQIDELADIAQLQTGQPLLLARQPSDLVALARELASEYQATSDRHRIRVETTLPELICVGDRARLSRVLDNLLNNAVKYSPAGGEIVLSIEREADSALICVQDRGIGIPSAELPHIFDAFYRAQNVVGQIAGSGLGLAGVRKLVEAHRGSVSIDSREGDGTRVSIRLPLAPADDLSYSEGDLHGDHAAAVDDRL